MIAMEKTEGHPQNPSSQQFEAIDSIQVRNPWHQKMQQQSLQEGHTIKLCSRVSLLGRDDPIRNESKLGLHTRSRRGTHLEINGKC